MCSPHSISSLLPAPSRYASLLLLLSSSPLLLTSAMNWDNLNIPNINLTFDYTTGAYERNFSRHFFENTMTLNMDMLTRDTSSSTLSPEEEIPILERFRNESRLAHCIFDDFFDMHTFRMKPEVMSKFLEQLADMCQIRVEETDALLTSQVSSDVKREQYEIIKRNCDHHIEEFSIRVLKTYKEEVKMAASHHYDLKPQDPARIKYEERIDSHFTRLGFEFLPIVEKYFQKCSDKYYLYFKELPRCDMNMIDEREKETFHEKVNANTLNATKYF